MVPRASEVAAASMIGARRFPHYATHRPDGGDLDKILACGRAVVTVNSTVSSLALACGLPVIALGNAVYDIAGLTHQGELAEFWNAPKPPDPDLFDAFRRVLAP